MATAVVISLFPSRSFVSHFLVIFLPAQVMEEGERLSKKQLAQESTIKKLRASAKEAGEQRSSLDSALASERSRLQDALAARAAAEEARQVQCCSTYGTCYQELGPPWRRAVRLHPPNNLTCSASAQVARVCTCGSAVSRLCLQSKIEW